MRWPSNDCHLCKFFRGHLPTACTSFGLQIKSSTTERRCINERVSLSKSNISMACASGRWFTTNKDTWPEDGSRYTLIPWGLNPLRSKFFSVSSTGSWSGLLKSNANSLPSRLSISGSYQSPAVLRSPCLQIRKEQLNPHYDRHHHNHLNYNHHDHNYYYQYWHDYWWCDQR